jgi:hypothetical protein
VKEMVLTEANGNGNQQIYATTTEDNGIRNTLDEFMKAQEAQNKSINSNLERLLKLVEISGAKDPFPEDKGSSVKGKTTPTNYMIPQLRRPKGFRPDPTTSKRVNFASSSSNVAQKTGTHNTNSYHNCSQEGQYEGDEYTEYDEGDEFSDYPWNINDHEDPFPKQPFPPPLPYHNTNPPPNPPPHPHLILMVIPHQLTNPIIPQTIPHIPNTTTTTTITIPTQISTTSHPLSIPIIPSSTINIKLLLEVPNSIF